MKVAVITGASRGLGLETARQLKAKGYRVVLTARDEKRGHEAALRLGCDFFPLDVLDPRSIDWLYKYLKTEYRRLDVLVNNAAVFHESSEPEAVLEAFETNTLAPFRLAQRLLPLMRENGYGRVVNVSSSFGQLAGMKGDHAAYRISKAALNAVTRIFADQFADTNVLVNSVDPGWVRTDMGGPNAGLTVEQGADTIVWCATLPAGAPTGRFFSRRELLPW